MIKLIKLKDEFILVSDEEIKEATLHINLSTNEIEKASKNLGINWANNARGVREQYKKIIAGIPELPSIDFSLLSEEDCKKIGAINHLMLDAIDTTLKYADGYQEGVYSVNFMYPQDNIAYQKLLKASKVAQSLNDKLLNLDFLKWIDEEEVPREDGVWIKYFNGKDNYLTTQELYKYWQSLQQKSWDVAIETELNLNGKNGLDRARFIPKIIDNSIKILKIL